MKLTLLDVLTVVFVVLKLIGIITWSWWWVLAPQWIPVLILIIGCIAEGIDDRLEF